MKSLSLSDNGITTISKNAFLGLLSLRFLDMGGNKLTGIVTEFVLPPAANIVLSSSDMRHITGPILIKSSIQKIDLSYNNLFDLHPLAFLHMNETNNILLSVNFLTFESICGSVWEPLILLRSLNLVMNSITFLPALCFSALRSLMILELKQNNISKLDNNCFKGLQNVYRLDLNDNKLEAVWNKSLHGLFNLKQLLMSRNKLNAIQLGSFTSTRKLEMLMLGSNTLQTSDICHFVWQPLINLNLLSLRSNRILIIESGCFKHLTSLEILLLQNNIISNMENDSFDGLASLRELNLGHNRLQVIKKGSLIGLHKLKYLNLEFNEIEILQAGSFRFMKHLTLIKLKGNLLVIILEDTFPSILLNMCYIMLDQNPLVCSCTMSWLEQYKFSLSAKSVCKQSININKTFSLKQYFAEQCSDWHLTTALTANDSNVSTNYIQYNFILLNSLAALAFLTILRQL